MRINERVPISVPNLAKIDLVVLEEEMKTHDYERSHTNTNQKNKSSMRTKIGARIKVDTKNFHLLQNHLNLLLLMFLFIYNPNPDIELLTDGLIFIGLTSHVILTSSVVVYNIEIRSNGVVQID